MTEARIQNVSTVILSKVILLLSGDVRNCKLLVLLSS